MTKQRKLFPFLLGLFYTPIWSRAHVGCLKRGEKCLDKSFEVYHSQSRPVSSFYRHWRRMATAGGFSMLLGAKKDVYQQNKTSALAICE